jgi:DNA-binding CsgD family transcriptional regulator
MPEAAALTYWNLFTWPMLLVQVVLLVRLGLGIRGEPDDARRLVEAWFASMWLGQLGLAVAQQVVATSGKTLGWVLVTRSLALYTNLAPVAWLLLVYVPWAGSLAKIVSARVDVTRLASARGLSERELEVLTMMLDGLAYKEIASGMSVSIHTVKSHVYNLFRKMDVRSRHQLIHRVTTAEHEAR